MCGPRHRSSHSPWLVDLDVLAGGDRVDQLDLEQLALGAEVILRLVAAPHFLREGGVPGDDLVHLLLDARQILRHERLGLGEIVEEAVLDHRADRHLRAGKQRLHGLRHHVRAVVPDQLERFGIGARDEFDARHRSSIGSAASASTPSSTIATVRLASEGAIDLATSSPVLPRLTWRFAPSGNVNVISARHGPSPVPHSLPTNAGKLQRRFWRAPPRASRRASADIAYVMAVLAAQLVPRAFNQSMLHTRHRRRSGDAVTLDGRCRLNA